MKPISNLPKDSIEGFLSPGQFETLTRLALSAPKNSWVIEVGSYMGLSTRALAESGKRVMAFDLWEIPGIYCKFCSNLINLNTGSVIPIRGRSPDILREFSGIIKSLPIGMAFLDSDHSHGVPMEESDCLLEVMKNKSILAFHDCNPDNPDVWKAWEKHKIILTDTEHYGNLYWGFVNK